jgi:hypothetical protein
MSSSRLSYEKEYEQMEAAVAEEKGTRIHIGSREAAMTYRLRLNRARQLDRKLNADAYEPGMKMYNASIYDELVFTVRMDNNDEYWVYLEKALAPTHVEALE